MSMLGAPKKEWILSDYPILYLMLEKYLAYKYNKIKVVSVLFDGRRFLPWKG